MKLTIASLVLAAGLTAHATSYVCTGYCHCALCCGRAGQPTASGHMPQVGITIAAPRSIPFGTRLNIAGIGVRVVQDRLAPRYDSRIDIFFKTHAEAKAFGIKIIEVK